MNSRWGKFFPVIFLISIYSHSDLLAQDTNLNQQFGVGLDPWFSTYEFNPLYEVHYRRYYHKKLFSGVSAAMRWDSWSTDSSHSRSYLIVPSAEFGLSLPFFKLCRFNVASRTSVYISRQDYKYDSEREGYYYRTGLFIGPQLGLDIVPWKTDQYAIKLFGYLQSGFGIMHDKWHYSKSNYNSEETQKNSFGTIVFGIAIQY